MHIVLNMYTCVVCLLYQREKLPPRPDVVRAGSVSPQRWSYHMDTEGRVQNKEELMQAIFKGVSSKPFY